MLLWIIMTIKRELNCYPLTYLFNEATREKWWKDTFIAPRMPFCDFLHIFSLSFRHRVNSFWIFIWCQTRDIVLSCWGVLLLFKPHSCLFGTTLPGPDSIPALWKGAFPHIFRTASLSRSGFICLGTMDLSTILVVGTVLGLAGCLAASLVSAH